MGSLDYAAFLMFQAAIHVSSSYGSGPEIE